jgi:flagellar assembly protein FliH
MARAGVRKFTYDTIFTADGRESRAPEDQRQSFTPEELKEARKVAFAEGERSASAEAEKAAALALEGVLAQLTTLKSELDGVCHGLKRDAVEIGLAGARAAAGAALDRFPEETLATLLAECAESLRAAPLVVASAPAAALEVVRARISEIASTAGLEGAIDVREGDGPARLEWSAGAATIDAEFALARAREAAERWLAASEQGVDQFELFAERQAG